MSCPRPSGLTKTIRDPGFDAVGGVLVLLAVLGAGCLSPEADQGFDADAPILLRPAARDLRGTRPEDVAVRARETVIDKPLATQSVRDVAQRSKDAVVSIYVRTRSRYRLRLLPFGPLGGVPIRVPGTGLGSGFFTHPSGYILTNNHVIEEAEEIRILTSRGVDYGVIVVARDPAYDLALLKAQATPEQKFETLPMGDSDAIGTGDMVIAVGNPLGLGHTVTAGIISQMYRNLDGEQTEDARQVEFIQTDTAINPGSSGGPLITLAGAWVGVNTAGAMAAQGIGFAVPSNQVREFLDEVQAGKGRFEKETR